MDEEIGVKQEDSMEIEQEYR
jgi:hypothetical protein